MFALVAAIGWVCPSAVSRALFWRVKSNRAEKRLRRRRHHDAPSRFAPICFKRCLPSSGYAAGIIGFVQRTIRCILVTLLVFTGSAAIIIIFELYVNHGGDTDSMRVAIAARKDDL